MARTVKIYTAKLIEGLTLDWRNRRFRNGLAVPITAAEVQDFRNNGRFEVIEKDAKEVQAAAERGRARSRSDTRRQQADRRPAPAPTKPVSAARLAALAQADVSEKLKRPTLDRMAKDLGARGPNGEPPEEAANKGVLVGWIQKRQGEVLAKLQADDPDAAAKKKADDDAAAKKKADEVDPKDDDAKPDDKGGAGEE